MIWFVEISFGFVVEDIFVLFNCLFIIFIGGGGFVLNLGNGIVLKFFKFFVLLKFFLKEEIRGWKKEFELLVFWNRVVLEYDEGFDEKFRRDWEFIIFGLVSIFINGWGVEGFMGFLFIFFVLEVWLLGNFEECWL